MGNLLLGIFIGANLGLVVAGLLLGNKRIIKKMMSKKDKKLLIEIICNEQTNMIIKDHTTHESERYKELERLKARIRRM